jgi:hypothetical protein
MKKIGLLILSRMLWAVAVLDLHSAPILCKQVFTCPIVENIGFDGDPLKSYFDPGAEGKWTVTGPWGNGGTEMAVKGNSRCSLETSEQRGDMGNPTAGNGKYCWCQMVNDGVSGVWVYDGSFSTASDCAAACGNGCEISIYSFPLFRIAICAPSNICDETAVIADGACPAGYAKCTGSKEGSDISGNYTINCSE